MECSYAMIMIKGVNQSVIFLLYEFVGERANRFIENIIKSCVKISLDCCCSFDSTSMDFLFSDTQ